MAMDTESNSKTTNNESTAYEASTDFLKAYARLRTVLDGMEITALRYCLKDTSSVKRIERAKEIEAILLPIIKKLENRIQKQDSSICPDGLFDCDGCCVPYHCID